MADPLDRIPAPREAGAAPLRAAVGIAATGREPEPARPEVPSGRQEPGSADAAPPRHAADRIEVHAAAQIARRLLRQRVLARTRERLELLDSGGGHEFAEVLDEEPVGAFLGRLLGAQNQLAALRAADWDARRVRGSLDAALRDGIAEVLELLAGDERGYGAGAAVVADVLSEYGRRLALLSDDAGSAPPAAGDAAGELPDGVPPADDADAD